MSYSILNVRDNTPRDLDTLLDTLNNKDIIYIGEFHQVPEVLAFQIDVISGLISKGLRPSIGIEVFNVLQQKILDYYIAGHIPFEQLLSLYEIGPEGFDLNHYRGLIEIAVKNKLKVIALNIPRSIASTVARHGLDKEELKGFHLNEDEIKNCSIEYKNVLSDIYKRHPHEEITEENFILAQSLKDEMMAETIVHYLTTKAHMLKSNTNDNKNNPHPPPFTKGGKGGFSVGNIGIPFIVIAGRGHIEYGFGIPERVRQKLNEKGKSVSDILIVAAYSDEHLQPEMADYAVLI